MEDNMEKNRHSEKTAKGNGNGNDRLRGLIHFPTMSSPSPDASSKQLSEYDIKMQQFYFNRIRATIVICLSMLSQSFMLGSSVVVGNLTLIKFPPSNEGGYAFNGLFI